MKVLIVVINSGAREAADRLGSDFPEGYTVEILTLDELREREDFRGQYSFNISVVAAEDGEFPAEVRDRLRSMVIAGGWFVLFTGAEPPTDLLVMAGKYGVVDVFWEEASLAQRVIKSYQEVCRFNRDKARLQVFVLFEDDYKELEKDYPLGTHLAFVYRGDNSTPSVIASGDNRLSVIESYRLARKQDPSLPEYPLIYRTLRSREE